MEYQITGLVNVSLSYKEGDKDSTVEEVFNAMYIDGIDHKQFFKDDSTFTKDGINALQRVLTQGLITNIKMSEKLGYTTKEDRPKFFEKFIQHVNEQLSKYDASQKKEETINLL